MRVVNIFSEAGSFAENKDIARDIRLERVMPALEKGDEVVLDFDGVEAATQSFVHALISDLLRKYGGDVLDRMVFKGCNDSVRKIITIVIDYMQEAE